MRRAFIGCLLGMTWVSAAPASATVSPPAAAHPGSLSYSQVFVGGASARLGIRCQALAVLEVIPADTDGDGRISADELGAVADQLATYLDEHYRLTADSGGNPRQGRKLEGELVGLVLDEPGLGAPAAEQWIEATLDYRTPTVITDMLFDVSVFMDKSPDHRDLCQLTWNDEALPEVLFTRGAQHRYYAPSSVPVLQSTGDWVLLGVDRLLSGWMQLAFLLALVVAARNVRDLGRLVLVFTLSYSLALWLAVHDRLALPERALALGLAGSLVGLGLANLLALRGPAPPRSVWPWVALLGLLHGLDLSSALAAPLWREPELIVPALAFHVGVELGLLAVVAVLALPLLLLSRRRPDPRAPVAVRRLASAAVTLAGAVWLVVRLVRG